VKKKLAVLCLAALGAALLVLGTAPAASAYPDMTCDVSLDRQVLNPGDTFTVTGRAGGVDSKNHTLPSSAFTWTFEWNGETKSRTGAIVTASFTAPQVTHTRTIPLTARSSSVAGECVHHFDIQIVGSTVVAGPHAGNGVMPNTGGPAFWILLAALVLLAGGGGVVVASRRHH